MRILGLMSGTSMDGLDCCLADLEIQNSNLIFKIIKSSTSPYKKETKEIIRDSVFNKKYDYDYLENYLGSIFSEVIYDFIESHHVDLISNHGQTISHLDRKYSIQVSSPKLIYEKFQIPVVYNFRQFDIDNGGNGAPLMPLLDWYLFNKSNALTINIGGISNISIINSKDKDSIIGFDTGPGMCLIDLYVKKYWKVEYDVNGDLSSKGSINKNILNHLMKDEFIIKKHPKSASTEMYGQKYLLNLEKKFPNINRYDFLRSLVNFTSSSIIKNIDIVSSSSGLLDMKVIISGGGVKNKILFNDIKKGLNANKIILMNYNGIDIDNKESFLMCLLGYTRYFNIPNNIPSVTGAKYNVVCGEIYE